MNLSYFYSTQEPLKSNGNNCRDSKLGISYLRNQNKRQLLDNLNSTFSWQNVVV